GTLRRLYSVDTWKREEVYKAWEETVKKSGCWFYSISAKSSSQEWFKKHPNTMFDLIFIDGDHKEPTITQDFTASYACLNPGGWLAMHNVENNFKSVLRVWETNKHLFSSTGQVLSLAYGRKPDARPSYTPI
ncbi:unnamed protein product, partial [marine sediment metagenome]